MELEMPLKELLARDLYNCIDAIDETIPSEESIRLMIEHYKSVGRLNHPVFIKLADVPDYIEKISNRREAIHTQLFIESGTRSLLKQGDPEAIHYSGMDIFCEENGNVTAFVADHFNGRNYSSYIEAKYDKISHIARFIVAGGTPYQTDSTHCAIFTVSHLLMTASDSALHDQLMTIAEIPTTEKYISLPWFNLPPKYNLATQSFKQIHAYIDHIKKQEALDSNAESPTLRTANFDVALSKSLETDPDLKVKNRLILTLTREYLRDAYVFMNTLTEKQLISICYDGERVRRLLNQALETSPDLEEQPLFELVFSNQTLLNLLTLKNESKKERIMKDSFYQLLTMPAFILLTSRGMIDPKGWFDRITSTSGGKIREIDSVKLSLMVKNSRYLDGIVSAIEDKTLNITNSLDILDLLLFKNTHTLFEIERIRMLYFTGQINNAFLCSVTRPDLTKSAQFDSMTDGDLIAFLKGTCSPTSIKHASSPLGFFAPVIDAKKDPLFKSISTGKP